jgi:hypothetical protein
MLAWLLHRDFLERDLQIRSAHGMNIPVAGESMKVAVLGWLPNALIRFGLHEELS